MPEPINYDPIIVPGETLWVVYQHFTLKTGAPPQAAPTLLSAPTRAAAKAKGRAFRVSASGRFIASYGETEILAGPIAPVGAERPEERLAAAAREIAETAAHLQALAAALVENATQDVVTQAAA